MGDEHMTMTQVGGAQSGAAEAGVRVLTDWSVLGIVWLAADQLAGWGWSAMGIGGLLAGWALVLVGAGTMRWRGVKGAWLVEAAGGLMVLAGCAWVLPPTAAGFGAHAYGFGLVASMLTGWRRWVGQPSMTMLKPWTEPLRVLLVTVAALWVVSPLITDQFTGGTDGRWYAFMLHDFIEQWRTQGPPVFLGQGELVWVGAVHPFRSAPVYMHVAGMWDWLTLQALGTGALQHLTVVTAVLAGGWGMYAAGVILAPRRRWEAAAVAVLYVLSPGVLMPLYLSDAYMTYMASAAFVWVFYGNARVLAEGRGWIPLAAGLSLAWMCHPPTAMQVTVLSAVLQAGGLALRDKAKIDWFGPLGAAGLFGLLSLGYFVGMSELPRSSESGLAVDLGQVLALVLGWWVGARVLILRRGAAWLLLLLPVAAILWRTCPIWLGWLALTLGLLAMVSAVGRWRRWEATGYAPLLVLGAVLMSAWLMDGMLRAGWIEAGQYPERSRLLWSNLWSDNFFKPLSASLQAKGDFQPGWGLWLAGGLAGCAACRRGALAAQLVFGAILLMSTTLLPWPGLSSFMLEHLPYDLVALTGLTMALRVMPVFSALLAVGGLLALREWPGDGRATARWRLGLLLLATGWAVWQSRHFIKRGELITVPVGVAARDWRSENAPMDRFVYDLLPMPTYFSHGKMDARLEVRLLDDQGNLIYGPPQIVEAMEAAGTGVMGLDAHEIVGHPAWSQLEPPFTLQPGEHRLLRFVFNPARQYSGVMILSSRQGYREYELPESGMRRSFGTGPEHSRVISLWNSGPEPEKYGIQYLMRPGNDLAPGMHFAMVTWSAFRPELALIQVESLNPWRVRTRMPWSGQLETPRIFLPGYEVKVDGRRIGPSRISGSPDRLLQIAMPPGEHTVEVRYVGTLKLRLAGLVSLAAWIGTLAWLAGVRPGRSVAARFWSLSPRVGINSTNR